MITKTEDASNKDMRQLKWPLIVHTSLSSIYALGFILSIIIAILYIGSQLSEDFAVIMASSGVFFFMSCPYTISLITDAKDRKVKKISGKISDKGYIFNFPSTSFNDVHEIILFYVVIESEIFFISFFSFIKHKRGEILTLHRFIHSKITVSYASVSTQQQSGITA